MQGKIPPHNEDAERRVLGACMLSGAKATEATSILSPDDFYNKRNKDIFSAICRLVSENISPDLVSVHDRLQNPDATYLAELTDTIPVNTSEHCRIIKDKAIRRAMINRLSEIINDCYTVNDTSLIIDRLNQTAIDIPTGTEQKGPVHISETAKKAITEIRQQYENKDPVVGISTGLADLDAKMQGLKPSEYVVLAGRPSMGKTALALNFADNAAAEGEGVIFFSLEMKDIRLVKRMLSAGSRVSGSKMRTGYITEEELYRIEKYSNLLQSRSIFIDDSAALTITELSARAKRIAMQHKIGLIIVDYIQLARGMNTENRALEVGQISSGLLALAKDLDVSVVALSQLNRNVESRQSKRPMMSDLKESGSIEQDADVVLLIYRDEVYNHESPNKGTAEIIIGKGRDIGNWTINVGFNGERTEFFDLARQQYCQKWKSTKVFTGVRIVRK